MSRLPIRSSLAALMLGSLLLVACASTNTQESSSTTARARDSTQPYNQQQAGATTQSTLWTRLFGKSKDSNESTPGASDETTHEQIARLEEEVTRLRRQIQQQQSTTGTGGHNVLPGSFGHGPHVGVLITGASKNAVVVDAARRALRQIAEDYPVTLVEQTKLREQLQQAGCSVEHARGCTPALAIYPGIRILAIVDGLAAASSEGRNQIDVRITLVDTDLDVTYQPIELSLPVVNSSIPGPTLQALADDILLNALDRLQIAPNIYHVFRHDGSQWYLNAGRNAGLKPGDELSVHQGGKVIHSPAGTPAAWLPGPVKGRLRVERLAGSDLALVKIIGGTAPKPSDPITLAGS